MILNEAVTKVRNTIKKFKIRKEYIFDVCSSVENRIFKTTQIN